MDYKEALKKLLFCASLLLLTHPGLAQTRSGSVMGFMGPVYAENNDFTINTGEQIILNDKALSSEGLLYCVGFQTTRNYPYGLFFATRFLYQSTGISFKTENTTTYKRYDIDYSSMLFSIRLGSDLVRSFGWSIKRNKSNYKGVNNSLYFSTGLNIISPPFYIQERGYDDPSNETSYANIKGDFKGTAYISNQIIYELDLEFGYRLKWAVGSRSSTISLFVSPYQLYTTDDSNFHKGWYIGFKLTGQFERLHKHKIYLTQ